MEKEIKELVATVKGIDDRMKDLETKTNETKANEAEVQKKIDLARQEEIQKAQAGLMVGQKQNSDEQVAMRMFGCHSVKKLFEINTGDPRFAHVNPTYKSIVRELKSDLDISRMIQQMFHGESQDQVTNRKDSDDLVPANVKGVLDGNYYAKNVLAPKLKALGTGTVGEGAEFVPTIISSQFIEEFEILGEVLSAIKTINMPSGQFNLPKVDGVTRGRIQAEGGTLTSANFGTNDIKFDAIKISEFTKMPEELNEDSAPDILRLKRMEVSKSVLRGVEFAILNGDDTATHMDSDIVAGDDSGKAWKGLRRLALDNSATADFGNAAPTLANMRAIRKLMDKFGVEPRNMATFASPKAYLDLVALDEVTKVDSFGPQATILSGALAALDGTPIFNSEFVRTDLAANGQHDGVTTDRGVIYMVNLSRFLLGIRRPLRVRAVFDPTPPNDQWLCAAWWRGDFQGHEQDANEASVALGINLA